MLISLAFFILIPTPVSALNRLYCRGNAPVYGVLGKKIVRLDQVNGFSFTEYEYVSLQVGVNPKAPWLTIDPWDMRMQIRDGSFKKEFLVNWSTDEDLISLSAKGRKSGVEMKLLCQTRTESSPENEFEKLRSLNQSAAAK